MPDKDDRLLTRARIGDKSAFGILVNKYRDKVLYLAFDIVGNYDDAKDIAQEAFIRAYTRLDQFEERANFSTWLYRIAVNLALDEYRRKKRTKQQSIDDSYEEIDSRQRHEDEYRHLPDAQLELDETRVILKAAIEKLSENQKTATILKYFHQKTSKEISEIMGCAESTVRIHIHRAMENLGKITKLKK